jgi:Subtilase family
MIVVGATDSYGYRADVSQYEPNPWQPSAGVDVYAPGVNIECDGAGNGETGVSHGKKLWPPSVQRY